MAITFLRHASLPKRYHKRYNGWRDIPIEPQTIPKEAYFFLERLSFDKVYSSNLQRCTQTLERVGICSYQTDARLREVAFKPWVEGRSFEEISQRISYHPSLLESEKRWHRFICQESLFQFEKRLNDFLATLDPTKEILICSHGGSIKKMLSLLGYDGISLDYLEWIRIENGI